MKQFEPGDLVEYVGSGFLSHAGLSPGHIYKVSRAESDGDLHWTYLCERSNSFTVFSSKRFRLAFTRDEDENS